ncbi:elongator complex protein 5 [Stomoxys calcitrans]|uniref:Elongator complex protein 5 n=1 Tax=Stomoxys calcitrans TaxID=35570 RepID=A0A1I8PAM2_STOCA|nr:elongator complex protein 5 [Stomoxys calcitrans]
MLSNLIVTPQRLVVILDELGQEKISEKFLTKILREQGEDESITMLAPDEPFEKLTCENNNGTKLTETKRYNVVLPNLSDLLVYQKPAEILNGLNKLKKSECIKRSFLWISPNHLACDHAGFLIAACEYMADIVMHLQNEKELTILTRKPGGGVTNNRYAYTKTKTEFMVQAKRGTDSIASQNNGGEGDDKNREQLGTFKIELDEEEMVARNAMKMPYEKAMEAIESNIIYTPDAADDFDDEDPDEDLNI